MLCPIQIKCGPGNPPEIFTTNASESTNALLKYKVDYKRNELPVFVNKAKELLAEQRRNWNGQLSTVENTNFLSNITSYRYQRESGLP